MPPKICCPHVIADIDALASTQKRMLRALWPLLVPGGRLVYATCSLLRAENEEVLADFRAHCVEARDVAVPPHFGIAAGGGRQNLPGTGGMDGFLYAIVEKPR